jgi:hypothetical protein
MSAALFNLVIDWVMRKTTEDSPKGIRWSLFSTLDLWMALRCCLTHTSTFNRRQTDCKHTEISWADLRIISTKKTETMTLNVEIPAPIKIKDEELRQTNNFTYLGSIITSEGGTKEDIHSRLGKASRVFREMNNI